MFIMLRRCAAVLRKAVPCVCGISFVAAVSVQGAEDTRAYQTIRVDPKYQANLAQEGQRVLGGCIDMLRKASPETHIDAFIDDQSIKYAGSEAERFQLEKCMAQYGFPIVSMRRPGLPDR